VRLAVLLGIVLAQAGIGYAQYLTGIPEVLVGFHLAGATAVWAGVIWFYLGLFAPATDRPVRGVVVVAPDARRRRLARR
jgi:heme A synthase